MVVTVPVPVIACWAKAAELKKPAELKTVRAAQPAKTIFAIFMKASWTSVR